ncbi:hypothetical protein BOTCAL_0165g00050 [Botryotinia calthae]|uniref:Major facilitator superfamily (MFS) profile domain-containing protein n=1 Tax=Botryotinia calthae TaxID=38488 RepID=A0A4Y8D438_9HELO|nr:hypothetical protein BOTCAL_0165g00050 [Botryotinia calthae]
MSTSVVKLKRPLVLSSLDTSTHVPGRDLFQIRARLALTIFFVPYILFEIPSNILMKHFQPHIWLSGSILAFGIVMFAQGFVKSYSGLLATRFFLGLAEAGIFPGSFYLISIWYKREECILSGGVVIVCWYVMNLQGHVERAIGTAWMIGFGNAGGIIATFSFLTTDAPYYHTGYSICMGAICICAASCTLYGILSIVHNREMGVTASGEKEGKQYAL